jgi:hypothetical protein
LPVQYQNYRQSQLQLFDHSHSINHLALFIGDGTSAPENGQVLLISIVKCHSISAFTSFSQYMPCFFRP